MIINLIYILIIIFLSSSNIAVLANKNYQLRVGFGDYPVDIILIFSHIFILFLLLLLIQMYKTIILKIIFNFFIGTYTMVTILLFSIYISCKRSVFTVIWTCGDLVSVQKKWTYEELLIVIRSVFRQYPEIILTPDQIDKLARVYRTPEEIRVKAVDISRMLAAIEEPRGYMDIVSDFITDHPVFLTGVLIVIGVGLVCWATEPTSIQLSWSAVPSGVARDSRLLTETLEGFNNNMHRLYMNQIQLVEEELQACRWTAATLREHTRALHLIICTMVENGEIADSSEILSGGASNFLRASPHKLDAIIESLTVLKDQLI